MVERNQFQVPPQSVGLCLCSSNRQRMCCSQRCGLNITTPPNKLGNDLCSRGASEQNLPLALHNYYKYKSNLYRISRQLCYSSMRCIRDPRHYSLFLTFKS
uniref:Uncharacterized protein n=1 Tax=Cacopsylla melanoneura TaxID=428564 RepID=A0A8D9E907_9HEMI